MNLVQVVCVIIFLGQMHAHRIGMRAVMPNLVEDRIQPLDTLEVSWAMDHDGRRSARQSAGRRM
jgi:hypothetical protein